MPISRKRRNGMASKRNMMFRYSHVDDLVYEYVHIRIYSYIKILTGSTIMGYVPGVVRE